MHGERVTEVEKSVLAAIRELSAFSNSNEKSKIVADVSKIDINQPEGTDQDD